MKNKVFKIIILVMAAILFGAYITSIVLTLNSDMSTTLKYVIVGLATFMIVSNVIVIAATINSTKRKREDIKRSFDSYVEESVATTGVGLIIFDNDQNIVWISKFIEDRLNKSLIGKKLLTLSESFANEYEKGKPMFRFELNGIVFQTQVNFETKTIILKDITNEDMVMRQYISEKTVICELEIDNFQQLQTILAEEDLFKVQSNVIHMLDYLAENFNLIYRQYVNGKFLIYTNRSVLDKFIANRFDFFDQIRSVKIVDGITLSASMGVGVGSSQIKELIDLAKDGLLQSLARGGDQVALMESNKKPVYFGSKSETIKTSSRVKIKQIAKLLEQKLESPEIKKVIIYGHIYADLDAVGAALSMAHLAKEFGKEAYIQNKTFDATTQKAIASIMSKEDQNIFIKKTKANKLTLKKDTIVIIVDTAEMHRIENDKALSGVNLDNVFIFDHHRVSELPKDISTTNTYIDTSASSASEITTEVLQFISRSVKPTKEVAQMALNGIYLDTKQFTKSVSSRTFASAAWLERFGANSSISTEILKLPEQHAKLVSSILANVNEIKPGYFLSVYPGEVPQDIISLASDELLRVQGRKAAFVIAKIPGKQDFKLSARGNDTNVQVIAEAVGGGGHFGAAAAVSSEPIDIFKDNVVHAIVSLKGDQ